jgi:hypothetical protein
MLNCDFLWKMETRDIPSNFGHIPLKFKGVINLENSANRESIRTFDSENNCSGECYSRTVHDGDGQCEGGLRCNKPGS